MKHIPPGLRRNALRLSPILVGALLVVWALRSRDDQSSKPPEQTYGAMLKEFGKTQTARVKALHHDPESHSVIPAVLACVVGVGVALALRNARRLGILLNKRFDPWASRKKASAND